MMTVAQACVVIAVLLFLAALGMVISWLRGTPDEFREVRPRDPACGRRVCAWCVPHRDLGPAPGVPAGVITHECCAECLVRERARIERLFPEVKS
jgi:hypothetical protein